MRFIEFLSTALLLFSYLWPVQAADRAEKKLPDWVWSAAPTEPGSHVHLKTQFDLLSTVSEARVMLATEYCRCQLIINDREVAQLDNFGPLVDLDATDWLKPGANTVAIRATAADGPSAVAMSLLAKNGDRQHIVLTDQTWKIVAADKTENTQPARSLGTVAPQYWISRRQSRVTAFDDYTQWKQAQAENSLDGAPAQISALPGFEVQLIRQAEKDEGSWVSMAFDPQGRLTIAREDQGLLRLTFGANPQEQLVETIDDSLKECRGLVYAHGALYANANNLKGLYKLTVSADGNTFGAPELLREFPGGVGHGRNDLALGPDGLIYSIHGDSVSLPQHDLTDLTSPFRDGSSAGPIGQGHLVRCDKDGKNWELVATGLRNPFGIDFNANGDLFTYDADAEFDMGAPWYRPTRLNHLTPGADFGWRALTGKWPPYELDRPDNALPVATIGKGSPTAVKFGTRSQFPEPWKNALFILDWAYGRIVACHLYPRGGSYQACSQVFLQGRPLNVTDLDFGPDGAMYFVTGGRKTESSLYRVRWVGRKESATAQANRKHEPTHQQRRRNKWTAAQRKTRHELESMLTGAAPITSETVWTNLGNSDPSIRRAAVAVLEKQPVDTWNSAAITEQEPRVAASALLSLSRSLLTAETAAGVVKGRSKVLQSLLQLPVSELDLSTQLSVLQTFGLCLQNEQLLSEQLITEVLNHLQGWLRSETESTAAKFAPVGAGGSVAAKLSRLVMQLRPAVANPNVVSLLNRSTDQHSQIFYLFLLRTASTGWQRPDRIRFFELLNTVEQSFLGGDGMPGFLKKIREEALQTLSEAERSEFADLMSPSADDAQPALQVVRSHVRDWKVGDIAEILQADEKRSGNIENGGRLFEEVLCSRCHRMGHRGGVVGPDLTSAANRFSRHDLLKSILAPSDVVAEKYRGVTVQTIDGKTVTGRVVASGDYRSPSIRIATDPLNPSQFTEILKANIEDHQPAQVSPMPTGLLSSLTKEDILDLLTFLVEGPENLNAIP